jgi:glycosyltransferase involved in cell wall biosynthesis
MGELLVFTENYGRGGGNRYMIDLINGVAGLFDAVTIASNPGGVFDQDVARIGVDPGLARPRVVTAARAWNGLHAAHPRLSTVVVHALRAGDALAMEYNAAILGRLISHVQPAAVLSCCGGYPTARASLAMLLAASRRGVPTALSLVSMPYPRRRGLGWYEAWLDRRVWRSAGAVIVNVAQIGEALRELRDLPQGQAIVVRNGLSDDPHRAAPHVMGERLLIGCVSRMDERKGTRVLLEAFGRLAVRYPAVDLLLAGDGPESGRLRGAVESMGLAGRVTLTGHFAGDVAELVSSFDIYAFPSLWEGLPYAVLEAMRAGCAIVSTDVGGISEAVAEGVSGLLVSAGSVDELTAALERLVADPLLRRRLGAGARDRFVAGFSLAAMHEQARRVFREGGLA